MLRLGLSAAEGPLRDRAVERSLAVPMGSDGIENVSALSKLSLRLPVTAASAWAAAKGGNASFRIVFAPAGVALLVLPACEARLRLLVPALLAAGVVAVDGRSLTLPDRAIPPGVR